MVNQAIVGTITDEKRAALAIFDRAPADVRLALADYIERSMTGLDRRLQIRVARDDDLGGRPSVAMDDIRVCPLGALVYEWMMRHPEHAGISLQSWIDQYACSSSWRYGKLLGGEPLSFNQMTSLDDDESIAVSQARKFIGMWDGDSLSSAELVAYLRT